jgi:arylsulfatase A-like enzyme
LANTIIVILFDDMRAEDWRALPKTRGLMSDGTWFNNFILTSPVCAASRINILTGLLALNTGISRNKVGAKAAWEVFRDSSLEHRTFAKGLGNEGWATGMFGKYLNAHPIGRVAPGWSKWFETVGYTNPNVSVDGNPTRFEGYTPDILVDRATAFLSQGPQRLAYIAPYTPHVPSEYELQYANAFPNERGLNRDRLRCLLSVDDAIARMANSLGPRWDNAVVIATSDNGHLLGANGGMTKGVPHDGAIRVPMMIRGPGFEATDDDRLASNVDLAPTIMRAAGFGFPWSTNGRPLQDDWERNEVLIQGSSSYIRDWVGMRTHNLTYFESLDGNVLWDRTSDDEKINHLTEENAPQWAEWLDQLQQSEER